MAEKFPFFLQIEDLQAIRPNATTQSLYVECIAANAAGHLFQVDMSLSRPAAIELHQHIAWWLAETKDEEPPRQ